MPSVGRNACGNSLTCTACAGSWHGLDCEPGEDTHAKKRRGPLGVAEGTECDRTDKTSGDRWEVQHRRVVIGSRPPIESWPVR